MNLTALVIVAIFIIAVGAGYFWWSRSKAEGAAGKPVITLHYTDWCPACKRMKPVWEQVKSEVVGAAVIRENDEDRKRTPGVKAYPTIYRDYNGRRTQYTGGPDIAALRRFV